MTPSLCELLTGMAWQFAQRIGSDSGEPVAPWFTWARWTPATPVAEATAGGATAWFASALATLARPAVPWHEVQDIFDRSVVPSTCRSWFRMAVVGSVAASALS